MKARHALLAILVTVSATAKAQVAPAATGPGGLPVSGTLKYDLRYTDTAQFYGGAGGNVQMAVLSGDLTYANADIVYPSTVTYSGGDMWNIGGSSEGAGVFQHLVVSQGYNKRNWGFTISDNVSYSPQAPTSGFSGIPGVGSLPGLPTEPSQSVLTLNTRSVYNMVTSDYRHNLNYATSLDLNGSFTTLRFPDGNGLDTDSLQAGPRITRRLNAFNSLSGQYNFTHIGYPGLTSFTMETQTAMFGYDHTWSRRLKTSVSAGPQWIQSSDRTVIPSSLNLSVNASANYQTRSTTATLNYTRGASAGSGIATQVGVHDDNVSANLIRQFGKNLNVTATGAFMRTTQLNQAGTTNAKTGGVSASRRLGRSFTVFANYTATQQATSSVLTPNAIHGLSQVIGFGVGYSPREMHFKK